MTDHIQAQTNCGDDFKISIVIPVYSAGAYVSQAVSSALQQPETAEVLLIEDGSPDNALSICQELGEKYEKVILLQHPNGENRGAGASRNLGIKNAHYDYIAFLDADDFFLPGRFEVAKRIFEQNPTCEGVYEAVGNHVENQESLTRWEAAGRPEYQLYMMTERILPEKLADSLISGGFGFFHLDGFLIKKSALKKAGLMAENLRLHQDTDFMIRIAIVAKLLPGRLDVPVAKWRVHDHNRISATRSEEQKYKDRILYWISLYRWCKEHSYMKYLDLIMRQMIIATISTKRFKNSTSSFSRKLQRLSQLIRWLLKYPDMLFELNFWHEVKNLG